MFVIGKAFKYTSWAVIAIFAYHMFLIKKYSKPEEKISNEYFLEAARFVDWSVYDFKILFTRPGMTKMLPDKIEIPGM